MSDLQIVTDIVAIVFMGLMLLILFVLLVVIFTIKHKIDKTMTNVHQKLDMISNVSLVGRLFKVAKKMSS